MKAQNIFVMKKIILLFILGIFAVASYSQTTKKWRGNYLLNGHLQDTSVSDVTLRYTANTKFGLVSDTLKAIVANQQFSFTGFIDEPLFATLTVEGNDINLFLDPTIMSIEVEEDNKTFTIKGSTTTDDYLEIEELRKGFAKQSTKELETLRQQKEEVSLSNIDEMNRVLIRIANAESRPDLAALTFAAKDRGSFAVLKELDNFLDPENKYYKREVCAQMLRIYSQMPESLKETPTGVDVSGKLLIAKMNLKF